MIIVFRNITFLFIFALLLSCEDPAPIEIVNEEEEVEVEIINPQPNSIVITGYDSTGITDEIPENESVISVSGIKNTINNVTYYKGYGEAVFFDTTKPVFIAPERRIGFATLDFGSVKFGSVTANVEPYILRYRENYIIKDTLLGVKHTINYERVLLPQQNNFPYNKNVNIEFKSQQGRSSLMTIRLPKEIKADIQVTGSRLQNNLKITLTWENDGNSSPISGIKTEEIIVGGILESRDELIPLFRLSRFNSNRFVLSNSFVEDVLSSGEYDFIVFTFLRKIRKSNSTSTLGDVHFASQSIHNIWIKI